MCSRQSSLKKTLCYAKLVHMPSCHHQVKNRTTIRSYNCLKCQSKILSPLLTLRNPLLQQHRITRLEPNLKRLRLCGQCRRYSIAFHRIQDGVVSRILRRMNSESRDDSDKSCVQLAIREMRAGAHAGSGAVAVVRSTLVALGGVEVAFWNELFGVFEVGCVVVCSPGIL